MVARARYLGAIQIEHLRLDRSPSACMTPTRSARMRLRTFATWLLGECLKWVIRVDLAASRLSSAIDGTGHYHVRPRPVYLWPSCVRSANNGHNRRSSGVPVSVEGVCGIITARRAEPHE